MHTLEALRAGELAGLARLDLKAGLTEFPREILGLADSLEILDLSGNRLSALPDDLARLHKLRVLFCSDNEFTCLPPALGGCPALEMVVFKSNRIATVDAAALPAHLRWLVLTDNRLAALPAALGSRGRLRKLMLSGNRLERLPEEMAACGELELVRLASNRFAEFPGWLFRLPRLAWLGLGGNPWSETPAAAAAMEEIPWVDLTLGGKLGEGASGTIYQASRGDGSRVAVKLFKGGMTSDGEPDHEMAVCLAAGNHTGLIGVAGRIAGHPDRRHGLAMPLVSADFSTLAGPPSLASCTRDVYPADARFHAAEVVEMLATLASAAEHLHARRILHGDFYGHNILRDGRGACLLGDFGAASSYPPGAPVERLEVRAFGCLVEELLERMDGGQGETMAILTALRDACLAPEVAARPAFAEIAARLAPLRLPPPGPRA